MLVKFSHEQVEFACSGLRISEQSKEIAVAYFCQGIKKVELAKKYDVTTAHVSKLIKRIETNFQKRLDLQKLEIVVVLRPK